MAVRGHLAGDRDQRDAVELGVGDGGDEVRRAGTAGGHADAHLARAASDALGGERAALLVPRQDGAELIGEPRQRLVQRHAGPARIGEDRIDAVVHQRLDQDIRPAGEFGFGLRLGYGGHGGTCERGQEFGESVRSVEDTKRDGGFGACRP